MKDGAGAPQPSVPEAATPQQVVKEGVSQASGGGFCSLDFRNKEGQAASLALWQIDPTIKSMQRRVAGAWLYSGALTLWSLADIERGQSLLGLAFKMGNHLP